MTDQLDAKTLARSRKDALRRRARRIRRSVAGLALALFTAAFIAVYVQLASGHDPALSAASKRQTTTTTTASPAAETSSESSTGGNEEATEAPSAVTTGQS